MANTGTVALTGLAAVLSGILAKRDRKLVEQKEKEEKKLRELKRQMTAAQVENMQIKNNLGRMEAINRKDLFSRLQQREQGIQQTPGMSSTMQGPPAPAGAERPVPPMPSAAQFGMAGLDPTRFGVPQPAKALDPTTQRFKETQTNVLSGALGGQTGGTGSPLVTGAKIGGVDVAFPGPTAELEKVKTKAREGSKLLDRQVVDQQVAQSSLIRDSQRVAQLIQADPSILGPFKGIESIAAARRATGQMGEGEAIVRTKLESMAVAAAVMRQGARPTEADVKIERNRLGQMFDSPQNFQALLREYIRDLQAIVQDRARLSKQTKSGGTFSKGKKKLTLSDGTIVTVEDK